MPHHLAAEPEMGEHPSHHRSLLQNWLARMAQVQDFERKPGLEGVVIPQESIWKLSHSSMSGTHGLPQANQSCILALQSRVSHLRSQWLPC